MLGIDRDTFPSAVRKIDHIHIDENGRCPDGTVNKPTTGHYAQCAEILVSYTGSFNPAHIDVYNIVTGDDTWTYLFGRDHGIDRWLIGDDGPI